MRKEVKIGIFAFLMLVLIFWGINFLKGKNLFTRSHTFYTTFRDVDGLNVSSDVMFRGMKVGTITDIIFNPWMPERIVVEFTVPKKYPVPNDSRITTINPYIIGGKVMVVEYGHSAQMYQSGDTIPAIIKPELLNQFSATFDSFKEQAGAVVDNLNRTMDNLDALLSEENVKNISGMLANFNRLTDKLQTSADNLNAITGTLKDNGGNIDRILTNVGEFSDSLRALELSALAANLSSTLSEFSAVMAKANGGDGSLGLLLNDPALYEELRSSSENLDLLLEDLKANPGRYVRFSLFGRKNK